MGCRGCWGGAPGRGKGDAGRENGRTATLLGPGLRASRFPPSTPSLALPASSLALPRAQVATRCQAWPGPWPTLPLLQP